MKVNGQDVNFKNNTTILDLLKEYGLKRDRVVVEINLDIIEEHQYEEYILKEEDIIELISFVGGG